MRLPSIDAGRARVHEPAAVGARAFAEVDHPVGGPDRLLVVLDDHDRVPGVADGDERLDQPRVVALVQAHRRLVEDVEEALHPRADLGGEPQAVRLAAREGRGRAVEGEVAEAERDENVEPREDLADEPLADRALPLAEREGRPRPRGRGRAAAARGRRRSGPPPAPRGSRAAAACPGTPGRPPRRGRAAGPRRPRRRRGPPRRPGEGSSRRRVVHAAAQVGHDPGEPARRRRRGAPRAPRAAARRPGASSEKPWRSATSKSASRRRRGAVAVPRADGAVEDAPRLVGHHPRRRPPPSAGPGRRRRGRPHAALLKENARGRELRHRDVAARAGEVAAQEPLAAALDGDEHDAAGEVEGLLEARAQARRRRRARSASRSTSTSMRWPRRGSSGTRSARLTRTAVDARALEPGGAGGGELLAEGALPPARDRGRDDRHGARRLLAAGARPSRPRSARRSARRSGGSGAGRASRRGPAGGRRSRSPSPRWSGGGPRSCAARSRSPGESPVTDSTSGRSICSRNWRAQGERLST